MQAEQTIKTNYRCIHSICTMHAHNIITYYGTKEISSIKSSTRHRWPVEMHHQRPDDWFFVVIDVRFELLINTQSVVPWNAFTFGVVGIPASPAFCSHSAAHMHDMRFDIDRFALRFDKRHICLIKNCARSAVRYHSLRCHAATGRLGGWCACARTTEPTDHFQRHIMRTLTHTLMIYSRTSEHQHTFILCRYHNKFNDSTVSDSVFGSAITHVASSICTIRAPQHPQLTIV